MLGDSIVLYGRISLDNRMYENVSLAVFGLNEKNHTRYKIDIEKWTIEIWEYVIIAWTTNEMLPEQLRDNAYKMCEKALDIYAMQRREYFAIGDAAWKYLLFYPLQDYSIIEIHNIEHLIVGVTSEVCTIPDTNEMQIRMSIAIGDDEIDVKGYECTTEKWSPVLRYYRFAQLSENLYDAYRWLYLTFEQLLQMLCPVKRNKDGRICEKENVWIKRALSVMDTKSKVLKNLYGLQNMNRLIEKFLKEQYREMRCKLFHAKDWAIIPNDEGEQIVLRQRYDELNNICTELLKKFNLLYNPYGSMTYYGFKSMIKSSFENANGFLSSMDADSVQKEKCVPADKTILEFQNITEVMPGKIDLHSFHRFLNHNGKVQFCSYGMEIEENVAVVAGFPVQVAFEGNVQVEQHMVIQMVNRGKKVI